MKRTVTVLMISLLAFMISCDCGGGVKEKGKDQANLSSTERLLAGEHELNSIKIEKESVIFTWRCNAMPEGPLIYSVLPVDKIREIEYDGEPFIKFRWKRNSSDNVQILVENYVIYMEVHCPKGMLILGNQPVEPENPSTEKDPYEFSY